MIMPEKGYKLSEKGLDYLKAKLKRDPALSRCLAGMIVIDFVVRAREVGLPRAMVELIRGSRRILEEDGIDLADVLEVLA